MEKDFHYYLIYVIAKITGMKAPFKIAYASQFVDDNNEGPFSVGGERIFFPEKIKMDGGYYYPILTQTLSPKSLDAYVQKYVYVPFHFLPGDNTVEIKGKKNPLSTTPNSERAQTILRRALKSDNPYLIGIALHTYVDTWSHQYFSGMREEWNAVFPWYQVFKSLVPNVGHAEVGHLPDILSEVWTDYRLKPSKVDNRIRAFEAVGEVFGRLRAKTGKGPVWEDVEDDFEKIVYTKDYDARIRKMSLFLENSGGGSIPDYSKDAWIDAALSTREKDESEEREVVVKPNFETTDWYHFHQAAKVAFATLMGEISPLL